MAPKGQKRAAPENKTTQAPKRGGGRPAKSDVDARRSDPMIAALENVVKQAADLNQGCRDMLIAGIRGSLSAPLDERQEPQTMVVGMLGKVVTAAEATLQHAHDEAKKSQADLAEKRVELTSKLSGAEAVFVEKTTELEQKVSALKQAEEKVAASVAELAEKKEIQMTGDAACMEPLETKNILGSLIENDLKVIQSQGGSCKNILPYLPKLNVEESMVVALPSSCEKTPAQRGSFDSMVLNQLETRLVQKYEELGRIVEQGVAETKVRDAAVAAAQTALTDAQTQQASAVEEEAAAKVALDDAGSAVEVGKEALKVHAKSELAATASVDQTACTLRDFQEHTRCPFEVTRDRVSSKATPPAVEEVQFVSQVTTEAQEQVVAQGDATSPAAKESVTEAVPEPEAAPVAQAAVEETPHTEESEAAPAKDVAVEMAVDMVAAPPVGGA